MQGSYLLRVFLKENLDSPIAEKRLTSFKHLSREFDQQIAYARVPEITQIEPNYLHVGKQVTITLEETSFDYRMPVQCLFTSRETQTKARAVIEQMKPIKVTCQVPSGVSLLAVVQLDKLSSLHSITVLDEPRIEFLEPLRFHNDGGLLQTIQLKLSQAFTPNIWLKFYGMEQLHIGVPHLQQSYLVQLRISELLSPGALSTNQAYLPPIQVSINGQDYFQLTPGNPVPTNLAQVTRNKNQIQVFAPFSIDYIAGSLIYDLQDEVTLDLYVKNVDPNIVYSCLFTNNQTVLASAASVKLNFVSIKTDVRVRNHKYVVHCAVPAQQTQTTFEIGLKEQDGLYSEYHSLLTFQAPSQVQANETPVEVVQYSIDGTKFKDIQRLVLKERSSYTLHLQMSQDADLPPVANCQYESSQTRALTQVYQVNLRAVTCEIPKLAAGMYNLTIPGYVSEPVKIQVAQSPRFKEFQQAILIAEFLELELETELPGLVNQIVNCNFGEFYGTTNGLLIAGSFSNKPKYLQCAIPQRAVLNQLPVTLNLESIMITPQLKANIEQTFRYASRLSYSTENQPKYITVGSMISVQALVRDIQTEVQGAADLECRFVMDERYEVVSTMTQLAQCAFKPSIRFDHEINGECIQVQLDISGLQITNVFTYCSDTFIFIRRVTPMLLPALSSNKGQLNLVLNRDVSTLDQSQLSCLIANTTEGQMHGSICQFDVSLLPRDTPLQVELIYNSISHELMPQAQKPVIVSQLPGMQQLTSLVSPYHLNELSVLVQIPEWLSSYELSFRTTGGSYLSAPLNQLSLETQPFQTWTSVQMVLGYKDAIKDYAVDVYELDPLHIDYLPQIEEIQPQQISYLESDNIEQIQFELNALLFVDSVTLVPDQSTGQTLFTQLLVQEYSTRSVGLHTRTSLNLQSTSLKRDLSYKLSLLVRYQSQPLLAPILLPLNTSLTQISQPIISSLTIRQNSQIQLTYSNQLLNQPSTCLLHDSSKSEIAQVPYLVAVRVCDLSVLLGTPLSQIAYLQVLNSNLTEVCSLEVLAVEVDQLIVQSNLGVTIAADKKFQFVQDGRVLTSTLIESGSYRLELANLTSNVAIQSSQCLLHGQISINPPPLSIGLLNITGYSAGVEGLELYLDSNLTSQLLRLLTIELVSEDGQTQQLTAADIKMNKAMLLDSNTILIPQALFTSLQTARILFNGQVVSTTIIRPALPSPQAINLDTFLKAVQIWSNSSESEQMLVEARRVLLEFVDGDLKSVYDAAAKAKAMSIDQVNQLKEQISNFESYLVYNQEELFDLSASLNSLEALNASLVQSPNLTAPIIDVEPVQPPLLHYNQTFLALQNFTSALEALRYEHVPLEDAVVNITIPVANSKLYRTHLPQSVELQYAIDGELPEGQSMPIVQQPNLECLPYTPDFYLQDKETLLLHFTHITEAVPVSCTLNGHSFELEVESIPSSSALIPKKLYRNTGALVYLDLPNADSQCYSRGQKLQQDTEQRCIVDLATLQMNADADTNLIPIDLVLGVDTSSQVLEQYEIAQIDHVHFLPAYNYTTAGHQIQLFAATTDQGFNSFFDLRLKHDLQISLEMCTSDNCSTLQLSSIDVQHQALTFEAMPGQSDAMSDYRCRVMMSQGNFCSVSSHWFSMTYVQDIVIQHDESYLFYWDRNPQYVLNVVPSVATTLGYGRYSASYSLLPTDAVSFELVHMPQPSAITLSLDSVDSMFVKLLLQVQSQFDVIEYGKLFYKQSEQLILSQDPVSLLWFAYIPMSSYTQRQNLMHDLTFKLGKLHFAVSLSAELESDILPTIELNTTLSDSLTFQILSGTTLIRAETTQFVTFMVTEEATFNCVYWTSGGQDQQMSVTKNSKIPNQYSCQVPKLPTVASEVNFTLASTNGQKIAQTQVFTSLQRIPDFTVSLLSLDSLLLQFETELETTFVACLVDNVLATVSQSSSSELRISTSNQLYNNSDVSCYYTAAPQVKKHSQLDPVELQTLKQLAFTQANMQIKSVEPAVLFLPTQQTSLQIHFTSVQEGFLQVSLYNSEQLYQTQIEDGTLMLPKGIQPGSYQVVYQGWRLSGLSSAANIQVRDGVLGQDSSAVTVFQGQTQTFLKVQLEEDFPITLVKPKNIDTDYGLYLQVDRQDKVGQYIFQDCQYLLLGSLLCQLDQKLPTSQYLVSVVYTTAPNTLQNLTLASGALNLTISDETRQQHGLITDLQLSQSLVRFDFQVLFTAKMLKLGSCLLLDHDQQSAAEISQVSQAKDDSYTCQIELKNLLITSQTYELRIYDQDGKLAYTEPTLKLMPQPVILANQNTYLIVSEPKTFTFELREKNAKLFTETTINLDGQLCHSINETHFQVTYPEHWFSQQSGQPYEYGLNFTHGSQEIESGVALMVYPREISAQILLKTPMVDARQTSTLVLQYQWISPRTLNLFLDTYKLEYQITPDNQLVAPLSQGFRNGKHVLVLKTTEGVTLHSSVVSIFHHYQTPETSSQTTKVAETAFDYIFKVPVPNDLFFDYKLSCSVNGIQGIVSIPQHNLFHCQATPQMLDSSAVEVRFNAHQGVFQIQIASDLKKYELVSKPKKVYLQSDPLILTQQSDTVITLTIEEYREGSTYCLLGGFLYTPLLPSDQVFKCTFDYTKTSQLTGSTVELSVSNFVQNQTNQENLVHVANLDIIDIGFFTSSTPLDNVMYPRKMTLGHLSDLVLTYSEALPIRTVYRAFSNLKLKCTFVSGHLKYQRKCYFNNSMLDEIRVTTKGLPSHHYSLTLTLNEQSVLLDDVLHLASQPVITGLYPPVIHTSLQTDSANFWITGRNFAQLANGFGCVLTFLDQQQMIIQGKVLESQLQCTVPPHAVYQQATISLVMNSEEIKFLQYSVQPVIQFKEPLQLLSISTRLQTVNSQDTIVFVELNQVPPQPEIAEIHCLYRYETQLSLYETIASIDDGQTIECDTVQLDTPLTNPIAANIGIKLSYKTELEHRYSTESLNRKQIKVLPLPTLVQQDYKVVHNQLTFTDLTLKGNHFHDSDQLICLVNNLKVSAVFQTAQKVVCRTSELKFTKDQRELTIMVSNDNGSSLSSNQLQVTLETELPRILSLEQPKVLLTGRRGDLIFVGQNLNQLQLEITGKATQTIHCNSTAPYVKMQCFDVLLTEQGQYEVHMRPVGRQGFIKSNLVLQAYEQPLFKGLKSQTDSYVVLDLDVDLVSNLKSISGLSLICRVYQDNFNIFYETPLKLSLNPLKAELEVRCEIKCDPDVRYLEFSVWVDHTQKLITTTQMQQRYHCQQEYEETQQVQHHVAIDKNDTYSQTEIFVELPVTPLEPLDFVNVNISDEHIQTALKQIPTQYDHCVQYPEACQEYIPRPYVQSVTYSDGYSSSNYLIKRQENSKVITFHGHSLHMYEQIQCLFGDEFEEPAEVIDEFKVQCTTPTFTQVYAPLRVGLVFDDQYVVWPVEQSFLTLIEMPQILSIGQNKQEVIIGSLPHELAIEIRYPDNWFSSAGYTLQVLLKCSDGTSSILPLEMPRQVVQLTEYPKDSCSVHLLDLSTGAEMNERAQFIVTKVDLSSFAIDKVTRNKQYLRSSRPVDLLIEVSQEWLDWIDQKQPQVHFILLQGDFNITSSSFDVYPAQASIPLGTPSGIQILFNHIQSKKNGRLTQRGSLTSEPSLSVIQPGSYCLELIIGESQSNTCSQVIEFVHRGAIWQTLDTIVDYSSLHTVVKGAYLSNLDLDSLHCLYAHYRRNDAGETYLYRYSTETAAQVGQTFECQLSDVFLEYMSNSEIYTVGLSHPDLGYSIQQHNTKTQAVVNPNQLPKFEKLSESTVYKESQLFFLEAPECSILYQDSSLSCYAPFEYDALPSLYDSITPDYALTSTNLTIAMSGHLFDFDNSSYFCLFNQEHTTALQLSAVVVNQVDERKNLFQVECQGPQTHLITNQTQQFTVRVYRDDGYFIREFTQQLTLYRPNQIMEVSPLLFDTQGVTQLLVKSEHVITSEPLRLQPLMCKFNFSFNGIMQTALYTEATVEFEDSVADLHPIQLITCQTPVVDVSNEEYSFILDQEYSDAYLSLTEYDGSYTLSTQARLTFVQPIRVDSVHPVYGYFSQTHLVTLKGNGFLPETELLQVRLLSTTLTDEVYLWQWDEIMLVDFNTIVVRMPDINTIQQKVDVLSCIFQVSINSGSSWSIERTSYTYIAEPVLNSLSHYESNPRAHYTLTVFGFNFNTNITKCYFGLLPTDVTVVNETVLECQVPPVQYPGLVDFTLLTQDDYQITSKPLKFAFLADTLITSVYPDFGDVSGGYSFTLFGEFQALVDDEFQLFWDGVDIKQTHVSQVTQNSIKGTVPVSQSPQAVEIIILHNLLTYQNYSTYFTYENIPEVEHCFPNLGPSRGGTIVEITGNYFNEQTVCVFDDHLEIKPIREGGFNNSTERILCLMPAHHETENMPLNLRTWNNQHEIITGCEFKYHLDISTNQVDPQNFYTGDEFPVNVTIHGLAFLNWDDDPRNNIKDKHTNSLRMRLNEEVSTEVIYTDSTQMNFGLNYQWISGPKDWFISLNYGVDWTKASENLQLMFNLPEKIFKLTPNKVQIAILPEHADEDHTQVDIHVEGSGFPSNPDTEYYCRVGNYEIEPRTWRISQTEIIDSNNIICKDVYQYSVGEVPNLTELTLQFAYNQKDFTGKTRVLYYPKVTMEATNEYTYYMTQDRLSIRVKGSNYINTATKLGCRITPLYDHIDYYESAFIHFENSTDLVCQFDIEPKLMHGIFKVSVANNDVQFVTLKEYIEIMQPIKIFNVWPSAFLVNDQTVDQKSHLMTIEAHAVQKQTDRLAIQKGFQDDIQVWLNKEEPVDPQCFFMPTSEFRAQLYESTMHSMIVNATRVNDTDQGTTFFSCQVPADLSDLAPISLDVRLGFRYDPKSTSNSNFQIKIYDRCPPGYYCPANNTMTVCPRGHWCPGETFYTYPRPCPIGYYQPKIRSQRCMPCIKGHKCPQEGMIEPEPCMMGHVCDQEKLNSERAECPQGQFCPVESTQGDFSYQNGLYLNLTQKCGFGTYCRGGLYTNLISEPENFESVVTECQRGMICHQGSVLTDGIGDCPSGHFCPNKMHTGIPCPPRYYCPGRGNIEPIKCPKGTFNSHFGQQNCTQCTLGRVCPIEGLIMPIKCPPGYICNDESLIIPVNVCRIGHICFGEVTSGLLQKERSCQELIVIDDKVLCESKIFYQKFTSIKNKYRNVTELITDDDRLDYYFRDGSVCCWNQSTTLEWIVNIGKAIGEEHTFQMYAEKLKQLPVKSIYFKNNTDIDVPFFDGLTIVERYLAGEAFVPTDEADVIDPKHNELIRFYIQKMYTNYYAAYCPPGYLCLEGVSVDETRVDAYLISTPFVCASGSYCLRGAQSVIGSGLCPVGFYCPQQSEAPVPSEPGTFTGNLGSVESSQCSPGTFQLEYQSSSCDQCPSGYECKERGTVMPSICSVGYYRSATEANICSMCPKGTFGFERSAKDYLECLECPAGRICEVEGLKNITESAACTDGRVCFSGTGAKQQLDCPQGYYCPPETTGETMFDNPCNKGFYCKSQTGESTKTRDNCPQTYYCPPGTGIYNYTGDPDSYDNWENDAPTRCPRGTGNDNSDTKQNLLQCGINDAFKLHAVSGVDLRELYREDENDDNAEQRRLYHIRESREKFTPFISEEVRLRNLDSLDLRRNLQSSGGQKDQMLQDLWEIMFEIHQSYDDKNPSNDIRTYINIDRQYIFRVNPVNEHYADEWLIEEEMDPRINLNANKNKIFRINPNSYMLVSMDFRHVMEQEVNWVYGEDWDISFTISTDLFSINATAQPVLLAEQFLHKATTKSQLIEFEILAWDTIYVRIDILIYNALYVNHKYAFMNTTSVEIRKPNRAVMNTELIFLSSIPEEYLIMLPFNQPPLQPDVQAYPPYLFSFARFWTDGQSFDPQIHKSSKNRNIWIPASLYWNQRPQINLAYLPYFSNCNGYGQHIPLWSLLEQNSKCEQVPLKETHYMTEFSFGQSPIADNCPAITIDCVYDEVPGEQQPLPRWFEVFGGNPFFDIVVEPSDYETQMNHEFDQFEVLQVMPEEGNTDPGFIPVEYDFVLSYYQKGIVKKKIIIVEIEFADIVELTEDENAGVDQIPYALTFSFEPLSHMKLTVMFAFQSYFYIILYILIGLLSILNMVIFGIYHRAVARRDRGRIAPFRFKSFFILTIPPSFSGVSYALFPVLIGNLLIAVLVTGRILTYNTHIYSCEAPSDSDCIYTFFDLIKDEPDNISVDYSALRNGRCGVALLVSGCYLMLVGLKVLIPDTTVAGRVQEAYNGNIWQYYQWKRSNMVYCSLWVIFYCLALIQFSFSDLFGDWIWTFIVILKLVEILIEKTLENALDEELLILPLAVTLITVAGLVTFGADDFLDFLQAYFIEFGMMIFERCYVARLEEVFFEVTEVKVPKMIKVFLEWINSDNQDEVVDENQNLFGAKKNNEDSQSTDSKVALSDENSMNDQGAEESDKDRDQNIIFQTEIQKEDSSEEFLTKYKPPQKSAISFNQSSQSKAAFEYDSESISISSGIRSEEDTVRSDSTIEDDVREEQVEPLISEYRDFAADNVYLFFSPFFVLLLWVFYEETVVAKNYGIKVADFVYYFLFQLVIVPFQTIVDIIQLNLTEWYHHLPIHDYLDYLAFRFTQRKSRWKGNENFVNNMIEKGQQSLDKLCFSSQFYFVQTIYVSGMSQIILGIQTLLWAENYNMFGDFCTIPMIIFTLSMCLSLEMMMYRGGHYFNVWKIDPSIEFKDAGNNDLDKDFEQMLIRISDFQKEEDIVQAEEVPHHLRFKLKAWNSLDRYKIQTMQLKADLQTDRLMADKFKDLFLLYNKPWLKNNVQEILTPRILFAQRQKVIEQLSKVLGEVQPDVEFSKSEPSQSLEDEPDSQILNKKGMARAQRWAKRFGMGGIQMTKAIAENKVSPMSRTIIRYWIMRMRFIRKLRVFAQSTISVNIAAECLYCRYTYGLQVQLIQSIEEMFYAFLREHPEYTINNFHHDRWSMYFRRFARYRTVCQECNDLIEDKYKKRMKKERLLNAVPDDDDMALVLMDDKKKENWRKQIRQKSARAKAAINRWVLMARYNLDPARLQRLIDKGKEAGEDDLSGNDSQLRHYRREQERMKDGPNPQPPIDKNLRDKLNNQDEVVDQQSDDDYEESEEEEVDDSLERDVIDPQSRQASQHAKSSELQSYHSSKKSMHLPDSPSAFEPQSRADSFKPNNVTDGVETGRNIKELLLSNDKYGLPSTARDLSSIKHQSTFNPQQSKNDESGDLDL